MTQSVLWFQRFAGCGGVDGGVAGTPLPFSDMEFRIIDEVVFKLGGQAVNERRLRLGREQIGVVHMGLIGGQRNLVSIRDERGHMSGGRVYPGFDRDGVSVSKTKIISLYAMVDHLELLSFDGFVRGASMLVPTVARRTPASGHVWQCWRL